MYSCIYIYIYYILCTVHIYIYIVYSTYIYIYVLWVYNGGLISYLLHLLRHHAFMLNMMFKKKKYCFIIDHHVCL